MHDWGDWSLVPPAAHQAAKALTADALGLTEWESEIAHTCSVLGEAALPSSVHFICACPSQGRLSTWELGDLLPLVY